MGPWVGSIPICPVLVDVLEPFLLVGTQCRTPHQLPQHPTCHKGCHTLAVHQVHQVHEEQPARAEVMRGSQWVKWLPQPLLVQCKGHVRERHNRWRKTKGAEKRENQTKQKKSNEIEKKKSPKAETEAMSSVGLQLATSLKSVKGLRQKTINKNSMTIKGEVCEYKNIKIKCARINTRWNHV